MDIPGINEVETKNTQKGYLVTLFSEVDESLMIAGNEDTEISLQPSVVKKSIIHFYFCLDGKAQFEFGPHYKREILRHRNYFFYNPDKDLPFSLSLEPGTRMVILTISLEHLHHLFVHEPLPFLKPENVNQKFYDERDIPANLLVELNQIFHTRLSENSSRLYYQGKILELLALYFAEKKPDTENCPFLKDQEMMRKIKHTKDHLLKNLKSPPSLRELARIGGLNEYQLKAGFREVYGNTVYGLLLDHKLDHARVLLDSMKFQVAEVAYHIGYSNPSHFIAAFKKKFGITPKKYLMAKG